MQHALSVALARSAVSPSVDTGRVPNVLDHLSLSTAMGFTLNCDIDDIRRLCWLWEWHGESLLLSTTSTLTGAIDDDNPFLVHDASNEWTRGAMGLIITPTTHFVRSEGKRIPAYGIGIEVEMDLASGKGGGMAAVARWTAEGESRKRAIEAKLHAWVKVCISAAQYTLLTVASLLLDECWGICTRHTSCRFACFTLNSQVFLTHQAFLKIWLRVSSKEAHLASSLC